MLNHPYVLSTEVRKEEAGLMVKDIVYGRLNLSRGLCAPYEEGRRGLSNGTRDYLTRRVKAGDLIQIVFATKKQTWSPRT